MDEEERGLRRGRTDTLWILDSRLGKSAVLFWPDGLVELCVKFFGSF